MDDRIRSSSNCHQRAEAARQKHVCHHYIKPPWVLQIEAAMDTLFPLTVVYVTHMLEGWGKETRSLGYDLSEREVITDPVMSEERQPDVSSAIKYSNVGVGLCDLPSVGYYTHTDIINKPYEPINLLGIKKKKKIQPP